MHLYAASADKARGGTAQCRHKTCRHLRIRRKFGEHGPNRQYANAAPSHAWRQRPVSQRGTAARQRRSLRVAYCSAQVFRAVCPHKQNEEISQNSPIGKSGKRLFIGPNIPKFLLPSRLRSRAGSVFPDFFQAPSWWCPGQGHKNLVALYLMIFINMIAPLLQRISFAKPDSANLHFNGAPDQQHARHAESRPMPAVPSFGHLERESVDRGREQRAALDATWPGAAYRGGGGGGRAWGMYKPGALRAGAL